MEDHVSRVRRVAAKNWTGCNLTQTALLSLADEEIPQRIAFVSDKVFEPRWWQTHLAIRSRDGLRFGAGAGAGDSGARVYAARARAARHAAASRRRAGRSTDVERKRVAVPRSRRPSRRCEARAGRQTAQMLDAAEKRFEIQRRADLVAVQETDSARIRQQMGRMLVAANNQIQERSQ